MKRIISLILACVIAVSIMPMYVLGNDGISEDISGTCDYISWTLTTDGILTISGKGEIPQAFTTTTRMPLYKYKSYINTIIIDEGITGINKNAFSGCSALTSVAMSNGVTFIGDSAFSGCSLLVSINIPEGVTTIGNQAFSYCSSLSTINIPKGVTTIGDQAFSYCSSLSTINIPEGVTSIGFKTFYDCSSLSAINIPEGVMSINYCTFYGCSSLKSINIPKGVTSIGDGAFNSCYSLVSINIPEGVISIGGSAFYGCSSLTSINIPEGVTSINSNTFYGCSSLSSIDIPNSVDYIGNGAFGYCTKLSDVIYGGSLTEWNSIEISSGNNKLLNADIIFQCIVTYDYTTNGGKSAEISEKRTQTGTEADLSHKAVKIGYNFVGWNTDPNAITGLDKYIVTNDVTLYAIFEKNIYIVINTVIYDYATNGGESSTVTELMAESNTEADLSPTATKTDYTFIGWNTDPNATTALESYIVTGDVTLYAIFKESVFTVTYDYATNGGESATLTQKRTNVDTEADLSPMATKTDYTFIGWNTDPNATSALDSYIVTDDVTLYAIFKKSVCTVIYDYATNGGKSATSTQTKTNINTEANLSPTATKTGWTFIGWNTDPNATTALESCIVDDDITLYAIFRKQIPVNFYSGNKEPQNIYVYNNETDTSVKLPEPIAYEGWTALGWRDDYTADNATINAGESVVVSFGKSYYAVYSRDISLSYDYGDSTDVKGQTGTQYYNAYGNRSNVSFTLKDAPEKDGFRFKCWALNSLEGTQYSTGDTFATDESATMYALWDKLPVVTYNYSENGGTIATKESSYAEFNSLADLTPTAEKEGWEFLGWNTDKDAHEALECCEIIDSDIVLYAIYKKNITARFYSGENNDLQEEITNTIYNNDTETTIETPLMDGINGWISAKWRKDTSAEAGEINERSETTLSQNTDYYAVYSRFLDLEYDANGGLVGGPSTYVTQYYNTSGEKTVGNFTVDKTPSRQGCTFMWWEADGEIYKVNDEITISDDTTLKAIWKTEEPTTTTPSGTYVIGEEGQEDVYVSLSAESPNSVIYYTTDGTDPTVNSTSYSEIFPKIMANMTIKAIAQAPNAMPSDIIECTFLKATEPHMKVVDTYATEAIIQFDQPSGTKQIAVQVSENKGNNWNSVNSILESEGLIRATGLSPETEYMFRIVCKYQSGELYSNQILGRTTEYVSSKCDVEGVLFPAGAEINQEDLSITSARVMNAFATIEVQLEVSTNATWELYSSKTAAERGINPISDKTINLDAGISKTVYIKVIAEDKQTYKIYSMQLYRQSKSSPPVFSVSNGSVPEGTELILSANGEIIKYTTDGTNPSESNGEIYHEPIIIDKNMTIKAAAKEELMDEYSDVITNVYYIAKESITPEIINANFTIDGYYVNFNMLNNTDEQIDGTAIIALYDENDAIIEVQNKDFNLEPNNMLKDNIEMTFITNKKAKYYKLFLWDGLSKMKPIMDNPYKGSFV